MSRRSQTVVFTIREESCGPFPPDAVDWEVRLAIADGKSWLVGTGRHCCGSVERIKCEYEIPQAWAKSLRKELEALTLHAAPEFTMGCDGGFTEFTVGDSAGGARYKWWSCPPRGWERLDDFTSKILLAFKLIRRRTICADADSAPQLVAVLPLAGMSHVDGIEAIVDNLEIGSEVNLIRETSNAYDPNAIAVFTDEDEQIGYIPRQNNSIMAAAMDNGQHLSADVLAIGRSKHRIPTMTLLIYGSPNPERHDLLESFRKEHLGGSYDGLRDFCIQELTRYPHICDMSRYVGSGRKFDCDDCDLMRALYARVWGLHSPDFRGDTMNSFRTMFGREVESEAVDIGSSWNVIGFRAFDRFKTLPESLRDRIWSYYESYHTIGNFLPLPDKKIGRTSLNTYRAKAWNDYFAEFLDAVKSYLENRAIDKLPQRFHELMDANGFFWSKYAGEQGFRRYVEEFFLEDYIDGDGNVIKWSNTYWWDPGVSEETYFVDAVRYIDSATRIIQHRASRIIECLASGAAR